MKRDATWIWGRRPVLEALRAGTAVTILIAQDRQRSEVLEEIRALAARYGVPLRDVPPASIQELAPRDSTQGVAARVEMPTPIALDALLNGTNRDTAPFLLALDQIQDPHNFGALVRTADAAGVQGIIFPEHGSAPLSGAVAKVSAGAISHVPIVRVTNLARALDQARAAGVWTVGLDDAGSTSIYAVDLQQPTMLVLGNEAVGLRRLTRERCDMLVRLPMLGSVASLNASVAGGIAMYEVVRQRSQ